MTEIMTPTLGESVTEATVAKWNKKAGDAVKRDEVLVELETDKVSLEIAAPADGVLSEIVAQEGATVTPGEILGRVSEGAAAPPVVERAEPVVAAAPPPAPSPEPARLAPSVARISGAAPVPAGTKAIFVSAPAALIRAPGPISACTRLPVPRTTTARHPPRRA